MSTSSSEPPTAAHPLARELAIAATTLLVVMLVFEGLLRVTDGLGFNPPATVAELERERGQELWRGQPWAPVEFLSVVERNADGFHAQPFTARAEGELRVAVLGDSFVEAHQVPRDETFAALADAELEGVQVLPLGVSGMWVTAQRGFLERRFRLLFGPLPRGKPPYPPVQAVVFCVRTPGLHALLRENDEDARSWRHTLLDKGIGRVRDWLATRVTSPRLVESLICFKLYSWFGASFHRLRPARDGSRRGPAAERLRFEVLEPLVVAAHERGLRVGFLYVPSRVEVLDPQSPDRVAVLEQLEALDAPWEDGESDLRGEGLRAYFQTDGHPTALGHERLAISLARLIRRLEAD